MKRFLAVLIAFIFVAAISSFASEKVYGDAYGDGVLNMKDLVKISQSVAGDDVTLTDNEKILCDVDRDMDVDEDDLDVLSKYLAKIEGIELLPYVESEPEQTRRDEPVIGGDVEVGAGDVFG